MPKPTPADELLARRERRLTVAINHLRELNYQRAASISLSLLETETLAMADDLRIVRIRAILKRIMSAPPAPWNKDLPLAERVKRLKAVRRSRKSARRKDRHELLTLAADVIEYGPEVRAAMDRMKLLIEKIR